MICFSIIFFTKKYWKVRSIVVYSTRMNEYSITSRSFSVSSVVNLEILFFQSSAFIYIMHEFNISALSLFGLISRKKCLFLHLEYVQIFFSLFTYLEIFRDSFWHAESILLFLLILHFSWLNLIIQIYLRLTFFFMKKKDNIV